MTIQGFSGAEPLVVRIGEGHPLVGEYEIDSDQAQILADGLVAVITNGETVTRWWIPREKIDYIRQVQSAPGPELPAPTPGNPNPPAPEDPQAPEG